MRHGRAKAARKTLQFFERQHDIRAPYHVLLDGTILVAAQQYHVPLLERLDRLLQHQTFYLVVTQSSLDELQQLSSSSTRVPADKKMIMTLAMTWAREHCRIIPHTTEQPPKQQNTPQQVGGKSTSDDQEEPAQAENDKHDTTTTVLSTAGQDILRLATATSTTTDDHQHNHNQHIHKTQQKFIVASQDEELLHALRSKGCVPVIRLARSCVLLLEQPSKSATHQASQRELQKWKQAGISSPHERILVNAAHEQERQKKKQQQQNATTTRPPHAIDTTHAGPVVTRRKHHQKAKGPNPLSCKTKKKDNSNNNNNNNNKRSNEEGTTTDGPAAKRKRPRRKNHSHTSAATTTNTET